MTTPGLQSFGLRRFQNIAFIENIDIELTNQCNFNCMYCYVDRTQVTHLDILTLKNIIDFCAENNVSNITLTGGEPFLYKHFDELMAIIEKRDDINFSFFSNGSFLKKVFKKYDFSQFNICLKRDCINDELQSLMCGISKMPYNFVDLVVHTQDNVHEVTVHSTLTAMNYKELPDLHRFCKKLGVPHYISRYVPARGDIKKLLPTPEMCKKVFSEIAKMEGKECKIPFVGEIGCIKMYCSLFIDRFGTIYPCSNLPIKVGFVTRKDFSINYEKLKIFRNINKNILGKCRTCVENWRCYGCRAIAYHLTGNYLESDPLCWK